MLTKRALVFVSTVFMVFAGLFSAYPSVAVTSTLYGNLIDGAPHSTNGTNQVAQSFTTGNSPATLTSLQLWLRNDGGIASSGYQVDLFSSSAGSPGSLHSTIGSSINVGAYWDDKPTLTPPSPVSLLANTQYFIVVSGTGGMTWKGNSVVPTTSISPSPVFSSFRSSNTGGSWSVATGDSSQTMIVVVDESATAPAPPPQ